MRLAVRALRGALAGGDELHGVRAKQEPAAAPSCAGLALVSRPAVLDSG